jgi:transposase InsO family protein
VREQVRLAFGRWGLPGRFRVDNGVPWGSWGEFPTDLSLWLIGLGVAMHWNNPRSPQENGVVERSQGTSNRWCEPWACPTPAELQERLEWTDRLYRENYPYRERMSRMAFFPGLRHSGRPYDPAREPTLWKWSRVADQLAARVVFRRVDQSGQVSL